MLPCGHVFGFECVATWLMQISSPSNCPTCRKSTLHNICCHSVPIFEIRGGKGFNPHRHLPRTLASGEELTGLCPECQTYFGRADRQPRRQQGFLGRPGWEDEPLLAAMRVPLREVLARANSHLDREDVPQATGPLPPLPPSQNIHRVSRRRHAFMYTRSRSPTPLSPFLRRITSAPRALQLPRAPQRPDNNNDNDNNNNNNNNNNVNNNNNNNNDGQQRAQGGERDARQQQAAALPPAHARFLAEHQARVSRVRAYVALFMANERFAPHASNTGCCACGRPLDHHSTAQLTACLAFLNSRSSRLELRGPFPPGALQNEEEAPAEPPRDENRVVFHTYFSNGRHNDNQSDELFRFF